MIYLESRMIGVVVAIVGVANFIAYAQEKTGNTDYKALGKIMIGQGITTEHLYILITR